MNEKGNQYAIAALKDRRALDRPVWLYWISLPDLQVSCQF